MVESITLTLGLAVTPRTRALFDGTVRPEGIQLRCESQFGDGLDNTGARHRAILGGAIDGGECSTSSLILARMRGASLRGPPVQHPAISTIPTLNLELNTRCAQKSNFQHSLNEAMPSSLGCLICFSCAALLAGRMQRSKPSFPASLTRASA